MNKHLPVVAIVGRPNVGKSSLFNRLLGERKSIVSEKAGTTRDRVEGVVEWNGQAFWLVDTAGLQKPEDEIEISMQEQIEEARDQSDLIVVVVDISTILAEEDIKAAKLAHRTKKPVIIAANKADRLNQPAELQKLGTKSIVEVSAIHGIGSGDLLDMIVKQIPAKKAKPENYTTIALLGRPNVGKSSTLNRLIGEKRAIVSDTPGTTRDVNQAILRDHDEPFVILDTAGLRRSGKLERGIEKFSWMRTIRAINEADVCLLITDATEAATAQDQRIAGLVKEAGKGLIIVVNKWDLTGGGEEVRKTLEAEFKHNFQFVWWAPLVFTSALTGHNFKKLVPLIREIAKAREIKVTTNELNRLLRDAAASHPPAGLKNRHPKLNYVTQTDTSPPTFTFFGAHMGFLHWSYKRYLETKLREAYGFSGTPVFLTFKAKNIPHKKSAKTF